MNILLLAQGCIMLGTGLLASQTPQVVSVNVTRIAGGAEAQVIDGARGFNRCHGPSTAMEDGSSVIFVDQTFAYQVREGIAFPYSRSLIRRIQSDGSVITVAGSMMAGRKRDGAGTNCILERATSFIRDPGSERLLFGDFGCVRELNGTSVSLFAGTYSDAVLPLEGFRTNVSIQSGTTLAFDETGMVLLAGGPFIRGIDSNGIVSILFGKHPAARTDGPASERSIYASSIGVFGRALYFTSGTAIKKIENGMLSTVAIFERDVSSIIPLGDDEYLACNREDGLVYRVFAGYAQNLSGGFDDPYEIRYTGNGALIVCHNKGISRVDLLRMRGDGVVGSSTGVVESSHNLKDWVIEAPDGMPSLFYRVRLE